MAEKV